MDEEEDCAFKLPSVLDQLTRVLEQYSDGQIIKELIQNAEDGGATEVKFLYTNKQHEEIDYSTNAWEKSPIRIAMQAPAICVYNNGKFTQKDWKGIVSVQYSIKENEPLKVGRFGLGFKSVFHLTDIPLIISGDRIMVMNPLPGVTNMVRKKKLSQIDKDSQEALLKLVGNKFGFSQHCFEHGYEGTLFWFPLRKEPSALSRVTYDFEKVKRIFHGFKEIAPTILLFLKKIEMVEVYQESNKDRLYEVRMFDKKKDLEMIRKQRGKFLSNVEKLNGKLGHEHLVQSMRLTIICEGKQWLVEERNEKDWIVVNHYHGGKVSNGLQQLIDDNRWSYSPYVSVAGCLSNSSEDFRGHIYCFLPLPLEGRSPTGLPVHINGFFALSQDRHHIKWMSLEEENKISHSESSVEWNIILATEILPVVYTEMLTFLTKEVNAKKKVYKLLPKPEMITENWKIVIKPLFKQLYPKNIIFTQNSGGRWITPNEAIVLVEDEYKDHMLQTLENVYLLMYENVACLSQNFVSSLKQHGPVEVSEPSVLHSYLIKHKNVFGKIKPSQKIELMEYFLSNDIKQLKNLELLPLANGEYQNFDASKEKVFCCAVELSQLFPGIEFKFVLKDLPEDISRRLSDQYQVKKLTSEDIPKLLEECIKRNNFKEKEITSEMEGWLDSVWKYIYQSDKTFKLSSISHLHLLPFYNQTKKSSKSKLLRIDSVSILSSKVNIDTLDSQLSVSLEKLGVKVFKSLPEIISASLLGKFVQYPTIDGIFNCMRKVMDNMAQIEKFNQEALCEERDKLLTKFGEFSNDQIQSISKLIRGLKIFKLMDSEEYACLNSTTKMYYRGNHPKLPIPYKHHVIECNEVEKKIGEICGGNFLMYEQLIEDILESFSEKYSPPEQRNFMSFFLEYITDFEQNSRIMKLAGDVCFVMNQIGEYVKPKDLYDPTHLHFMFNPCDFPSKEYEITKLKKLKKLGLRFEDDLTSKDILNVANTVTVDETGSEKIFKKGIALCEWIEKYNEKLNQETIELLKWKTICPIMDIRPKDYPKGLPFKGEETRFMLKKPTELFNFEDANLVGGVAELSQENIPQCFKPCKRPEGEVFEQLILVASKFSSAESRKFLLVLNDIHEYLNNSSLEIPENILNQKIVWDGFNFQKPCNVYIKRKREDLSLHPYRYPLPPDMEKFHSLFKKYGCIEEQNDQMLLKTLYDIKQEHDSNDTNQPKDQSEISHDTLLVVQIVQTLANSSENLSQFILLPIQTDASKLMLKPANECTVCNEKWLKDNDDDDDDSMSDDNDDDDEIFYVHKLISFYTAQEFNVPLLSDRLLCDADKLDMNFAQNEPLTTRLKNLLNEYPDGFTVPKEIIQNADDAGASVVKFLYDERCMPEAKKWLFDKGMEPVQGPAFWAYNDAKFTEADYENLTKLAGETKKDDQMKIGRFGLGFNSVYNLTDTPSFISGDTYVIFDPHKTHLQKPGLKVNLNYSKNRKMRRKMKGQFYPFEDIFQCKVLNEEQIDYEGTLFRFPLRDQSEANKSLIKDFSYSQKEMKEFIQKIEEGCGNLLMFTQNVKRIELYHLHERGKPSDMKLLFEVIKSSSIQNTPALNILTSKNEQGNQTPAQLSEEIEIMVSVKKSPTKNNYFDLPPHKKTLSFLISWSFGKDEAVSAAKRKEFKGLLPIAATAVLKNDQDQNIRNLGFYDKPHLFCFLPLPIPTSLPAHVNGSFAVLSSRKDLEWRNEDNMQDVLDWNMCLLRDACCQAYILMMTTMAKALPEKQYYNKVWPDISECTSRHDEVMSNHIYKTICEGDYKVFKSSDETVAIDNVIFLDPAVRGKNIIGEIAYKALCYFVKAEMNVLMSHFGSGIVVIDLPLKVWQQFRDAGCEEVIGRRMVTIDTFYSQLFFPTLTDKYWCPVEMNEMLLHGIRLKTDAIENQIANSNCIPTKPNHKRQRPSSLIHPKSQITDLFDESEECFPDDAKLKTGSFRDDDILNILVKFGMMKDDLPWTNLPERINVALDTNNVELIKSRFNNFLTYLSEKENNQLCDCPEIVRQTLSKLPFLPVKKLTWKFPQFTDREDKLFVTAREAYLTELQKLVGCTSPIIDASTESHGSRIISVLIWLGVKNKEKDILLETVVENMLIMSDWYNSKSSTYHLKDLKKSLPAMYKYLNDKIDNTNETPIDNERDKEIILDKLKGKAVILHNDFLTSPDYLVLEKGIHIKPYISTTVYGNSYEKLFLLIGMLPKLTSTKILNILMCIGNEKSDHPLKYHDIQAIGKLCRAFVNLPEEDRCNQQVIEQMKNIKLPDSEKQMTNISSLCFDDSVVVCNQDILDIKHLHKTLDRNTAEVFGVKSKRGHSFDAISSPLFSQFGQHEDLTSRISRILEGYPCDESILKEILQNADDAGATEVIFMKDSRKLPAKSLPDSRLKEVQGPALCIYNNSFFTEDDLVGIQELGTGNKKDDVLRTGQYGVGFNVVYHVTDVPSLWTKGGDVGETVCVFDPNCQYLSMAHMLRPGVRIKADGLRRSFPDFNQGFLPEFTKQIDQGTIFRLPLRNRQMAFKSKISQEEISEDHIDNIFKKFDKQVLNSMLFLENITSVKFGTVRSNGTVKILYEVKSTMDERSRREQKNFNKHLLDLNTRIKNKQEDAFHLPFEVTLCVQISDTLEHKEDYLIIKRAGFNDRLPEKLNKALQNGKLKKMPRGGVAMKLKNDIKCGIAYCTLPLPINTGLPVHINGQFALDHESRRNIWTDETEVAGLWNSALSSQIIVPAYLKILEEFKIVCNKSAKKTEVKQFEQLFPKLNSANGNFWRNCVQEIYKAIGDEKRPFFPVLHASTRKCDEIEWVAVQTNAKEFNGCFNELINSYFKNSQAAEVDCLKKVLIRLGMKVLESSLWIFNEFKQAKVTVQCVTPENVLEFLKSYQSEVENKCRLNIPVLIQTTPFGSLKDFKLVLNFVLTGIQQETINTCNLICSPLLLRQNQTLDTFGEEKIIVTPFCGIFDEFSGQFIHSECVQMLVNYVDKFPPLQDWALDTFHDMFRRSERYKPLTEGEIIHLNKYVTLDWISNVWRFISQRISKPIYHSTPQLIPHTQWFELLSRLSILPVSKRNDDGFLLYPLSYADHIFDPILRTITSATNNKMKEALLKLKIPCLVNDMAEYNTAKQRVASVDDPSSIVKLLLSNLTTSSCLNPEIALDILKYINERIDDIKMKAKELCQLNLFETHENSLTAIVSGKQYICLHENSKVPKEGITHWTQSSNTCILKYYLDTQKLFNVLNIKCVQSGELYYRFILPNFHCFKTEHHMIHLKYVRDLRVDPETQEKICVALQRVKFLRGYDENLHTACEFYDKNNPVFRVMLTENFFPPQPYNNEEWHTFLQKAGLVTDVSMDKFIEFARTVEKQAEKGIDNSILERSDVLLKHLNSLDFNHIQYYLSKIRCIKFVRRVTLSTGDHHMLIHKQFGGNSISLVSFADSFLLKDVDCVWTVANLIETSAVPSNFRKQLGIQTEISLDLFERNMKNVCVSLNDQTIWEVGKDKLEALFEKFYAYLKGHDQSLIHFWTWLNNCPTIFLPDKKKIVESWRVIMKPDKLQLINDRIFEAPPIYCKHFEVFESLGVKPNTEPLMYVTVLKEIYLESSGGELHENEFLVVKQCLENLIKMWENRKDKTEYTGLILYLPSMDKKMEPSTELIFMDNNFLHKRIINTKFHYFIGFKKLNIELSDQLTCINTWPKEFWMKRLSKVVNEKLVNDSSNGSRQTDIIHRLQHSELIKSLLRVMRHLQNENHQEIDNDDAIAKKVNQIKAIEIISIENMTTQLYCNDNIIDGSELKVEIFQDRQSLEHKKLYLDKTITEEDPRLVSKLSVLVGKILQQNISEYFSFLWSVVNTNPSKMSSWLDEQDIRSDGFDFDMDQVIFPDPGTIIPENKHWLLDNDFAHFQPGDYVGYEVYDPDVIDDSEDNIKCPVYIYAVIMYILQEESETVFESYKIDVGDEENIDVDSTKIYKFQRNLTKQKEGQTITTKTILKEIRKMLSKAWQILNETDRKRVIKRLLLKWHSETEIIDRILYYVEQLKKGQDLDDDDGIDDDDDDSKDYTGGNYTARNSSYENFYSIIHSRGQGYEQCSRNQRSNKSYTNDSSYHRHTVPLPNFDQAKRWFRQAKFDIEAAESRLHKCDDYNWICYICQQAAEKALKAALYTIDSRRVSKHHNLNRVATGLSQYPNLGNLASELQSCIGEHIRMRYPDTLHFPKVPKDIYEKSDSTTACKLARNIVNFVSNIVDNLKTNDMEETVNLKRSSAIPIDELKDNEESCLSKKPRMGEECPSNQQHSSSDAQHDEVIKQSTHEYSRKDDEQKNERANENCESEEEIETDDKTTEDASNTL